MPRFAKALKLKSDGSLHKSSDLKSFIKKSELVGNALWQRKGAKINYLMYSPTLCLSYFLS